MSLDLINGGRNLGRAEELFGRIEGEIADSNASDLASLNKFLQNGPRGCCRDIGYTESLRNRIDRREGVIGVLESDGPVDLYGGSVCTR